MFDDRDDEMLDRAAAELRRAPALDPELNARIMGAVRAEARAMRAPLPRRIARDSWRWLREPRTIAWTPLQAGAIAAGLVVAAMGVGMAVGGSGTGRETPLAAAGGSGGVAPANGALAAGRTSGVVTMQFVLVAPEARSVSVVGDFNGWDAAATPLVRASGAAGGVWTVTVPLAPGRHEYAFVVDGSRWMPDPAAPPALGEDFGAPSSVVTVAEHST